MPVALAESGDPLAGGAKPAAMAMVVRVDLTPPDQSDRRRLKGVDLSSADILGRRLKVAAAEDSPISLSARFATADHDPDEISLLGVAVS
jgi:hypothetical protein